MTNERILNAFGKALAISIIIFFITIAVCLKACQ